MIIYEVHNTFGERHSYVVPVRGAKTDIVTQHCPKAFTSRRFWAWICRTAFASGRRPKSGGLHPRQENDKTIITASLSGTRRGIDRPHADQDFLPAIRC